LALIFSPKTTKLVSFSIGSNLVASLAKESAISFPIMSV
jgi:hypothetical protein